MTDLAATIEQLSNRWMQAWVRKDRSVLEQMLASDFALVVSATPGHRLDRASWLATACTRYTCSEFRYRDVQVRDLQDGIAVMSSIAEFSAEIDGIARCGPMFLTDVWRLGESGQWQVCARYSSHPEPGGASSSAVNLLEQGK
ncbi:nuclear transport factor 2 family protein [Sphingomonas sp.]|uniref:nuclear transport factor 2 family protein n=1 Tax=Sphingomonas sp. TaxID=28214 RepID=UPI00184702A5|nr:nuclear transport factor 2 family protein [Sphingomonas sp.]MBA3512341.1 nuclear transport factor 2 family protein [Sphingomonas sp.]